MIALDGSNARRIAGCATILTIPVAASKRNHTRVTVVEIKSC